MMRTVGISRLGMWLYCLEAELPMLGRRKMMQTEMIGLNMIVWTKRMGAWINQIFGL